MRIRAIPAKRVLQVSAKEHSFVALDSNGVLYGWTADAVQPNGDIDRLRVWKEIRSRAAAVACGGSCSAALTRTPQFDMSLLAEPELQPPYADQLRPLSVDMYALLPSEITSLCAEPAAATAMLAPEVSVHSPL